MVKTCLKYDLRLEIFIDSIENWNIIATLNVFARFCLCQLKNLVVTYRETGEL